MIPTPAMQRASTAGEMAVAFHPDNFGLRAHRNIAFDAAEAALLWAAGKISRSDFLSVLEDEEPW